MGCPSFILEPPLGLPVFPGDPPLVLNNVLEVRISTIPNAGHGLFARCGFNRGSFICDYIGFQKPYESKKTIYDMDNEVIGCIIDGSAYENHGRWINNPPFPKMRNALSRVLEDGSIRIYATRQIDAGQEILMDYGHRYWEVHSIE